MNDWHKIADVNVTGMVWIGDIERRHALRAFAAEVVQAYGSGVAVNVRAGTYPVFARYRPDGSVASMRIDFGEETP